MRYELHSVRIEEFKSGPRAGQRKPVTLPKDAIPCGIDSGYFLRLFYLVPIQGGRRERA